MRLGVSSTGAVAWGAGLAGRFLVGLEEKANIDEQPVAARLRPNVTRKTLLHGEALPGENLRDGNCVNVWYFVSFVSRRPWKFSNAHVPSKR